MALWMNATADHNSNPFAEVTGVDIELTGERVVHSADVDAYLSWQAVVKQDRRVTVNADDQDDVLDTHVPGAAAATLTVVLKSADGGSDLTATGSAMVLSCRGGANHATPDHGGSVEFGLVATDGTTDPLSIS